MYSETSILDLSKALMQYFHYNYINNKYSDKAEIMLTDTDSLMNKTETENVYEDLYKDKVLSEFSNNAKDSKYYNNANNLVAGKMKDEICDRSIKVFVELKYKEYRFITEDNHKSKKAKGIDRNVVDDELKYENHKNVLFNRSYV